MGVLCCSFLSSSQLLFRWLASCCLGCSKWGWVPREVLFDWKGCDLALICPRGGHKMCSHNVLSVIHYNSTGRLPITPQYYALKLSLAHSLLLPLPHPSIVLLKTPFHSWPSKVHSITPSLNTFGWVPISDIPTWLPWASPTHTFPFPLVDICPVAKAELTFCFTMSETILNLGLFP